MIIRIISYVVIATTSRTYGSIPDMDFFDQDMNQSLFGEILFENRDRDIHNGVPSSSVVVMPLTPTVLSYVVIATPTRPYRSSSDMAFFEEDMDQSLFGEILLENQDGDL